MATNRAKWVWGENPQQPVRTVEANGGQEWAGAEGRSRFRKGFV